ncbi:nuclear transport factor 2 family protein [Streptomyces sp. NPDC057690]|uniref:nuclear transport factor 2 family protein n=1 Tax=Streptomyces sp. NPDC057690 TaxID=3346214 RepID=UPI0036CFE3AE
MTTTTTQTDHTEISMLVSRFFRALDERKFEGDWARDYVTDDVRTTTPIGAADGVEAMAHAREALERYARTQHITSDLLIDVEPASGRATTSWNALMTHVHHDATLQRRGKDADPLFTVGGYWEAELRRERGGWRFSGMSVQALWTTGQPPELPPETRPAPVA